MLEIVPANQLKKDLRIALFLFRIGTHSDLF